MIENKKDINDLFNILINKTSLEKEIKKSLELIQSRLENGIHAVCCFSYNLGLAFHGLPPKASLLNSPLIRAWFFKEYRKLSSTEVNEWIESRLDLERSQQVESDGGIVDVNFEIDEKTFCEKEGKENKKHLKKNF